MDDLSTEDLIERLQEESRSCNYPTDAAGVKKRYKDTALILFRVCNLFETGGSMGLEMSQSVGEGTKVLEVLRGYRNMWKQK